MDQSQQWQRHEVLRVEIEAMKKELDRLNLETKQTERIRSELSFKFQMALAEFSDLEKVLNKEDQYVGGRRIS